MNDVNRLRILQDVIDHRLTTRLAATRLEISDRHCRRLLERYREHGPLSLVNRRRGQPGNRQLMPGLAERALRIIRERYADFGPTLACEKLAEVHGLYLAKETVRKLMTQAGLWIPRKYSWLTTTAGLQSHLVTISTFTVRLSIMKIWRQHSPGVNIVKSQKT